MAVGEGVEAILEEAELSEEEREKDISDHSMQSSRIYSDNTQQLLKYTQFI